MTKRSFSRGVVGVLKCICPQCYKGDVFSGVYSMNPKCPQCGLIFERESGYFIGAMLVGYFLGAFSAIPTLLLLLFYWHEELSFAVGVASAQIVLANPFLFRLSRMTWIYLDDRAESILDQDH